MTRPTAVALSVVATAAIALAACQSILGIQDVEVTDGAAPTSDAGGGDASPSDGASQDAIADAAADTPDSSTNDAAACEIACVNGDPMQVQDLLADGGGMCLCGQQGGGPCASACSQSICKQPPMQPDPACLDCLGPAVLSPGGACHSVLTACGVTCSAIGSCAQGCGP